MPKKLKQIHPDNAHLEQADQLTDTRLERLQAVAKQRQKGLMVLMENVYNPFNLAAIARTCDAFGVQDLAFTQDDVSAGFNPREAGEVASRSAAKWIDYHYYPQGTLQAIQDCQQDGWFVIATNASTIATPLTQTRLTHPKLLLLVGNEQKGLSPEALALADAQVQIPMVGMVQSLNVSVATAIVLYEIVRQREPLKMHYSESEAQTLTQEFLRRATQPKRRK
jgi:tRNA (guanosine-2'-O-)-methyltransferase